MRDTFTTISLTVLLALSLVACAIAVGRLCRSDWGARARRAQYSLAGSCTLGCVGLFVFRAIFVHQGWQPLRSHVDGLLLIISLFSVMVLLLQWRGGVRGLATFALPLLTITLAWAMCASAWTFQWFEIDSIWNVVHRFGVYLGSLFFMVAATAGGMFLYARHRLRDKRGTVGREPLASLEAIEGVIVWASTLGFGLLTVGIVMGLIEITSGPTKWGPLWWQSPKIALAITVWLIYAVVMNTRHAAVFRGAGAAWLSIVGLVLLLATFGAVHSQSSSGKATPSNTNTQIVGAD